jgi:hypothetical protein
LQFGKYNNSSTKGETTSMQKNVKLRACCNWTTHFLLKINKIRVGEGGVRTRIELRKKIMNRSTKTKREKIIKSIAKIKLKIRAS